MKGDALGFIETIGLAYAIGMADAMVKAANVSLIHYEHVGSGFVTLTVQGDVASVQAAVDAGLGYGRQLGAKVVGHVIARPDADTESIKKVGKLDP